MDCAEGEGEMIEPVKAWGATLGNMGLCKRAMPTEIQWDDTLVIQAGGEIVPVVILTEQDWQKVGAVVEAARAYAKATEITPENVGLDGAGESIEAMSRLLDALFALEER